MKFRLVEALRLWIAILYELVRIWWFKDRIRSSSRDGCWLGIQVGDMLLIREVLFEVTDRTTMVSATQSQVAARLRRCDECSDCDTVLRMVLDGPKLRFVSSFLEAQNAEVELLEDDVVIIPRAPTTVYA